MDVRARDRAIIAGEIGREPRDLTGVAVRCPFGYPAVTESAPVLSGGEPNPTLLHLTCPTLAAAISRVEAAGGVRALRESSATDDLVRRVLNDITRLYRQRRADLLDSPAAVARRSRPPVAPDAGERPEPDPRLGAGVGGPEGPEVASCLHAYAAALLAVISGWLAPDDVELARGAREVWSRVLPPLEPSWCTDIRCAKWDTAQRKAAIDVGTISVRLLVADLTDGRPWTVAREAEVTRLGEGLEPGAPLDRTARKRTAEVVGRYVDQARTQGAETIVVAGTSAAREACDGARFIQALGRYHDVSATVLTGESEAELAYLGASLDIAGGPVVLDVGGGSTELTVRLGSGRVWPTSLRLGASRATGAWIRSDPPAPREIARVRAEAERMFSNLRTRYGASEYDLAGDAEIRDDEDDDDTRGVDAGELPPPRRLVGVAGTVTTLAALDAGLERYDAEVIHLRTLSLDAIRGLVERLTGMTTEERAALPCVQAGRAPVIAAGAVIVMAAVARLGYRGLTVSERDLLDGLVMHGPC